MSTLNPRPESAPAAPFLTRRSTLTMSAVALTALVAYVIAYGVSDQGTGTAGGFAALFVGITVVTFIGAWLGGLTLAMRSRSLLLVLVALLVPPFGPLAVALWSRPTPPGPPAR